MAKAAVSDLKAKLAHYLRLVKGGERVEVQERGVPVAVLSSIQAKTEDLIIPPRRSPDHLARMVFAVRPTAKFDVVKLLLEDRAKR